MKKISIILILLLSAPGLLRAGQDLTLAEALKISLENNFQIKIAGKDLAIAENNDTWADAGRYPTIDLTGSYQFADANAPSQMGFLDMFRGIPGVTIPEFPERSEGQTYTSSVGVSLNWMLFNGFAIYISKANLSALHRMSKGNEAIIVENNVQAVVLAYYKSLLEKEKLDITRRVKKLSKDKYDYAAEKKDLGLNGTFDLLQFKNAFLRDSANYLLQEINYKSAVRELNLLLGTDEFTEYNPVDNFDFTPKDYSAKSLEEKMLSNNKTLRNQYINMELAENGVDMAKSRMYPSLALGAGYNYSDARTVPLSGDESSSWNRNFYAGLSLNFNLYNGGNTSSAIQNAVIEQEISGLRIEEMKLALKTQLRTFYELYLTKIQLLNVSRAAVESTKLNLTIAEEKFNSGTINSFNYRDIQLAYLSAAFDELQAIYNLIDTHTELSRLTGGVISEF